MPLKILVTLLIAYNFLSKSDAGNIYIAKYKNQADLKVFVVDYPNQADLLVYIAKYSNEAKDRDEIWHYVKYPNQADVEIIFVKYANEADLKVYLVDYKNQAGWKLSHKWQGRLKQK